MQRTRRKSPYDIPFACAKLFSKLINYLGNPNSDFSKWLIEFPRSSRDDASMVMLGLVDSLHLDIVYLQTIGAKLIDVSEACQYVIKRILEQTRFTGKIAVSSADLAENNVQYIFKCFPFESDGESRLDKPLRGVIYMRDGVIDAWLEGDPRWEGRPVVEMYEVIPPVERQRGPIEGPIKCTRWTESKKEEFETSRWWVKCQPMLPFRLNSNENPFPKLPVPLPELDLLQSVMLIGAPAEPGPAVLMWKEELGEDKSWLDFETIDELVNGFDRFVPRMVCVDSLYHEGQVKPAAEFGKNNGLVGFAVMAVAKHQIDRDWMKEVHGNPAADMRFIDQTPHSVVWFRKKKKEDDDSWYMCAVEFAEERSGGSIVHVGVPRICLVPGELEELLKKLREMKDEVRFKAISWKKVGCKSWNPIDIYVEKDEFEQQIRDLPTGDSFEIQLVK